MTTTTTPERRLLASGTSQQFEGSPSNADAHRWMPNPDWRWWAFWRQRELLWTLPRSTVVGGSSTRAHPTPHAD